MASLPDNRKKEKRILKSENRINVQVIMKIAKFSLSTLCFTNAIMIGARSKDIRKTIDLIFW